ncbi:MAG: PepSY domain-containing protein [Pseudomonadota bacterium]
MRSAKGMQAGVLAIVALLAFAPGIASAKHDKDRAEEPPHSAGMSKDQVIDMAQRRYKARVVRAEAADHNGRRVYVLRMLSDQGRVWTVRVDALTGSEL